jgi:hypothetical protein
MALFQRAVVILSAFVAGNFLAVHVLLAGKVLADSSNLYHYTHDYFGGPFVGYLLLVLFSTLAHCAIAFIPTLLVLVFTETLRIRSAWFYGMTAAMGALLFDVVCTSKPGLIGMRSFCVTLTVSELAIVTIAGAVAGLVFWRIAGIRSGAWRSGAPLNSSAVI